LEGAMASSGIAYLFKEYIPTLSENRYDYVKMNVKHGKGVC
jgi:hypothetical protein